MLGSGGPSARLPTHAITCKSYMTCMGESQYTLSIPKSRISSPARAVHGIVFTIITNIFKGQPLYTLTGSQPLSHLLESSRMITIVNNERYCLKQFILNFKDVFSLINLDKLRRQWNLPLPTQRANHQVQLTWIIIIVKTRHPRSKWASFGYSLR